jgi:hypothetical protein
MNALNPLQDLGLGYNHTFQDMKSDSTFRSYMNTDMQESHLMALGISLY